MPNLKKVFSLIFQIIGIIIIIGNLYGYLNHDLVSHHLMNIVTIYIILKYHQPDFTQKVRTLFNK